MHAIFILFDRGKLMAFLTIFILPPSNKIIAINLIHTLSYFTFSLVGGCVVYYLAHDSVLFYHFQSCDILQTPAVAVLVMS